MTGTRMEFSFNDKRLRADLRSRLTKLENPDPFLKSIGEEFAGAGGVINQRFKAEKGPDGKPWAPLSESQIRRRQKKYGNAPMTILRMRGHLAGSINYQVSGGSLKIGTGKVVEDYAAIHQFGGEAGRGLTAVIPARPYLGFSDADMELIEEEAIGYFMDE
ncbi:phage virion morphogenesis protein [Ruegeria sp. ANG-R]|uniref:phage virion morphogenesis protein n=1 Tax=Ruegeria sp. ANG-R TaxID=1577903 RepID=UPI00068C5983|nr:phage virion morphogenesis protein [Ruegeria sp. ANG-R]